MSTQTPTFTFADAFLQNGLHIHSTVPTAAGEECPICQDTYKPEDTNDAVEPIAQIKSCGHYFHESCLRDWLTTSSNVNGTHPNTCPMCRATLYTVPNYVLMYQANLRLAEHNRVSLLARHAERLVPALERLERRVGRLETRNFDGLGERTRHYVVFLTDNIRLMRIAPVDQEALGWTQRLDALQQRVNDLGRRWGVTLDATVAGA